MIVVGLGDHCRDCKLYVGRYQMCLLILILRLNALTEFRTFIADNLTNLDSLGERLPAPVLFYHNARTTVVFLLLGLVSFGTLGLTLFIGNIALVGGVLGAAQLVGYSPLLAFAAGILPHGIFELSAIFLATAAMLKVGAQLVTPQPDKSLGETLVAFPGRLVPCFCWNCPAVSGNCGTD